MGDVGHGGGGETKGDDADGKTMDMPPPQLIIGGERLPWWFAPKSGGDANLRAFEAAVLVDVNHQALFVTGTRCIQGKQPDDRGEHQSILGVGDSNDNIVFYSAQRDELVRRWIS